MSVAAILVAAGSGSRLASTRPKAFVDLAGEPLVVHAARRLMAGGVVDTLVAVVPADWVEQAQRLLPRAHVVVGGASRVDSVAAGLAALPAEVDVVLVHDAARALAPPTLVLAVVQAVCEGNPAVVPGLAVTDTIKQVDASGAVVHTLDRASLRAVQTPQGFDRATLQRAHAQPPTGAHTDDAGLVEALGTRVLVVPGDPLALKITTPADLAHAERLLQ
ncbi:MAG: 2-C-methyl-D-erythritol 4-phosphate cytidylyltransferase [Rhodoferax sp.]|nr:2-C-methyl-D-erythritol 4-phosphate cytidylyltransferase [Actinomycetota bacterium]